jgi:beta-mannosidase
MPRFTRYSPHCICRFSSALFLCAIAACSPVDSSQSEQDSISLDGAWEFRATHDSIWQPATIPGDVMTDLINLGQLDSPYVQTNERLSQSFETKEWVYRKQFARPAQGDSPEMSYELVFDGIDTYATILLNGDTLGETSNAHRAYRLPASHLIDGLNTLEVWLHSAVIQGQRKLDASPWLIPVSNEDRPQGKQTSSVSRKALYQYGWDWGPRLVSAGVWKSISLQRVQISGPQNMRLDLQQLDATQATYLVHLNASAPLDWQLDGPEGAPTQHQLEQIHDSLWQLTIISPKRWWPRDMGDQPLYTLHCINDVGSQSLRFGIRSIEWVRARDDIGRSFACHVNGQKIFARGANIIPADFFPVRARERIEETLQQAVAANMNMVRVWGGAVYGEDAFYDRCDELGLLVWQDFMFACCMVPGDSAYAASVEAEARYNVKRLRHHPSLAIWCGNNESEKAWKSWGWPNLFGLSTQSRSSRPMIKFLARCFPKSSRKNRDNFIGHPLP